METRTLVWRTRRSGRRLRWFVLHSARKLVAIDGGEWKYLLQAQAALLWAQALVWARPVGRLVDSEPDAVETRPAVSAVQAGSARTMGEPDVAHQLALGVRRAAAYGVFRPLCLVRSVALNRLLDRHGIRGSRIRVGVRFADGKFAAHAWVEHEGRVLGDEVEHVSQFANLSEVRVLRWS